MDLATRFLIDECLSPDLAEIVKREYGMQAIHVPWLGRPPRGKKSWQDPDVVDEVAINDFVLVTNNRRDFVQRVLSGETDHSQRPRDRYPKIRS